MQTPAEPTGRRRRRPRQAAAEPAPPDRTADEPPIRAELFTVEQLARHAATMAGWHEVEARPRKGGGELLARLADNEATLAEAYALITDGVHRGRRITPAAEWFLDNYPLIEEQIRTARKHLPRSYHRELPRLVNASRPGTLRVYDLALELISHSHGRVDGEGLRAFVGAYQATQPLTLGELWAVPIMLRLALLENLRRVVGSIAAGRRDRERAAGWVDEMSEVASSDPGRVVLVLADMVEESPALSDPFVAELASRLRGQGSALAFPLAWLEQRLAEQGQTIDNVFQQVIQSQAADQLAMGNSIGSLRFLGAFDWRVFVEAMSVVEQALRTDPVYPTMDFATRDRYRHAVEQLARMSSQSELAVARTAVDLARGGEGRRAHVGYFLVDDGRTALELDVGVRRPLGLRLRRAARAGRNAIYAGSILVTTAALTALLAVLLPVHGGWIVPWLAVLALAASQLAIALVHWAATMLVVPRPLPRLDFARGIPDEHRTLVAVPSLLTDEHEVDELIDELEVRFLANRGRNLGFALVTDFRDAASEHLPADDGLLARARDAIDALNARYPDDGGFFLLHRTRRWNPRARCWMGWERKRGKLEDLNRALRGDRTRFATIVGPTARLDGVRYVLALDSDTELPRESARLLAATLAHPLNRPWFDEARGRVTAGYAILQPRVGVSMASTTRSRFARWFGGEPGIDPYTRAVSDVYQDVFDEGSFVGKGIYDVDAVQRSLGGRLPENRILSHDLLEGAYARSGLVSDVILIEDYPSTHAADVARRHRWTRGDWQIAAWLRRRVPGLTESDRNPISALSQWKVLDNLRRSLVPVALFLLAAVGWLLPGHAAAATLAVVAVTIVPGLVAAAAAIARRPDDAAPALHARATLHTYARQLARDGFALACLPFEALLSADAIVRVTGRVLVTRRRLLEWRTHADARRAAAVSLLGAYTAGWSGPAAAAAALLV
ncbi:MAG TPA: hypothetical protein VHE35_30345, partial [Kofleriaceae bacterium]|nr:hypothetical protein [Kofleriaceae bacterium]